ncbi:hypothetical protein CBL_02950 [Carabus blaptoides fortunei]
MSCNHDELCMSDYESDSGSDIFIPTNKRPRVISDSDDELTEIIANAAPTNEFVRVNTRFSNESDNFSELPGPKFAPASDAKPIEYFYIFFTLSLFTAMVTETNRYASQFLNSRKDLKSRSRAKSWKLVTIIEMKAFIAVLLEMGITRRPSINSYWSKGSRSIPWFGKMFARDRFQLILKFFHLVDNNTLAPPGHPNYDPCGKFKFLVDHANNIFREQYTPHRQLSIDESLVGTHCQSIIKQYLPNKKHHKWGIKFWMLCDAVSNYCLGFFCYRGAKSNEDKEEIKKNGLGYVVVLKLLSLGNYLNKGYHLFMDNFFTSIQLIKALLQKDTYLTGTIRRNRKDIPKEAKFADVGQPKYFKSNRILICSYRDKKSHKNPVILISTNSTTENITIKKKRGNFESQCEYGSEAVIFSSETCLRRVREQGIMIAHMDATFKVVPRTTNIYQLFTIHTVYMNMDVLLPGVRVESAMADYETALRISIVTILPGIRLRGCWFHYTKALYKKSRSHSLQNIQESKRIVKMAMALQLLPEEQIQTGLEILLRLPVGNIQLLRFLNYIRRQ